MDKKEYYEKLKDPRWQKMRLKVFERDEFCCQICFDDKSTLNVHHRSYIDDSDPWDYPLEYLVTLCENCHKGEKNILKDVSHVFSEIIKLKFFSMDIVDIFIGFEALKIRSNTRVTASIISFFLSNEKIFNEVSEKYFDNLKIKMKENG